MNKRRKEFNIYCHNLSNYDSRFLLDYFLDIIINPGAGIGFSINGFHIG